VKEVKEGEEVKEKTIWRAVTESVFSFTSLASFTSFTSA
jgi:hypothetical protein